MKALKLALLLSTLSTASAHAIDIYCVGSAVGGAEGGARRCQPEPMFLQLGDTSQKFIPLVHHDFDDRPCSFKLPPVISEAFAEKKNFNDATEAYRLYRSRYDTAPVNGSLSPSYLAYGELQFTAAGAAVFFDYENGSKTLLTCKRHQMPEGRSSP